jgi:hypothetical protein
MAVNQQAEQRLVSFAVEDEKPIRKSGTGTDVVCVWLVVSYARYVQSPDAWRVRCVEVSGYRAKRDGSAGTTAASARWWLPSARELAELPEWISQVVNANMPTVQGCTHDNKEMI